MRGPYPLSPLMVEMHVPCKVRGVFCLAREPHGPVVAVRRAEMDMREELKNLFGEYRIFWFEVCCGQDEGYVLHCRAFHKALETGKLEDITHPIPAGGAHVKCVVCGR
jgi:hypothetical protein